MPSLRQQAVTGAVLFLLAIFSYPLTAPLRAAETGLIYIESIPLEDYLSAKRIERMAAQSKASEEEKARARIAQTAFQIETPEGAGPFPALFFLHGCGGVYEDHYKSWNQWFLSRGYAFVVIDSFGPRGITTACQSGNLLLFPARTGDVYATLYHLAANSEKYRVDPRRVLIAGFSHGGITVLYTMRTTVPRALRRKYKSTVRIAGGFAFYAHCIGKDRPMFYNPVFILNGESDAKTPPEACGRWLAQPAPPGAAPLELHVFADAFHLFDYPGNYVGKMSADIGAFEEYSPSARAKSEKIIDAFMRNLDTTLAAKRAAADTTRRALTGNTLRLTLPNGRTGFQYLAADGRAPLSVVGARKFADLRWRVDDDGQLCRTNPRDGHEACLPAAIEGDEVVLHRPRGEVGQRAALLRGNRLPVGPPGDAGGASASGSPRSPGGGRTKGGAGAFLSEAQLRAAVIGNTVAFRAPSNDRDVRAYFAADGQVEFKASGAGGINRQQWHFKGGNQLCRALRDGRNHCIRAQKDPDTGALTFVHPKFSYQVTVTRGKQLSP